MTFAWKFSSSMEDLVQKCIESTSLPNSNNKWVQKFKQRESNLHNFEKVEEVDNGNIVTNQIENTEVVSTETEENLFYEEIKLDPVLKFDYLVVQCFKSQTLLTALAQKLPGSSVEKLCNHIFNNSIDIQFVDLFYKFFLAEYIKREHNLKTIDIVNQASKSYPNSFKKLLQVLITNYPSNVLSKLVPNLNTEQKSQFLTSIMEIELSKQEFLDNIPSIYLTYKDCKKTESIQAYMMKNLTNYGPYSMSDKNYGRLLMTFLQAQCDSSYVIDDSVLERLIDMHRSPFKKPCMTIFSKIPFKNNSPPT